MEVVAGAGIDVKLEFLFDFPVEILAADKV
jgi:hypothetical protein